MKKILNRCLSLISVMLFLLSLCACSKVVTSMPAGSESEAVQDTAAFVSDFLPGEENRTGNIWSNSTLCSQGNYVYHYNGATECFEKWTKDSSPDQAVTISMQPNVSGHIEVVGDYIYFCQKSNEVIGKDTLYNIMKLRTDGNELTTVRSDCLNGQFRIVDDMLFYLSLYHKQTDASTEEYYITTKQDSLTCDWVISWPVTDNMGVPVSSNYYGTHTPTDFFVITSGSRPVLGYTYITDQTWYRVCYDIEFENVNDHPFGGVYDDRWFQIGDQHVESCPKGDTISDTEFWDVRCISEDETTIYYQGRKSKSSTFFSRYYKVSVHEWPDISEAQLLPLTGGYNPILRCVADGKYFYSCSEGLFYYDVESGKTQKINNDEARSIQYVGDGRVYYSLLGNSDWDYYCCNLDGSDWTALNW